MKYHRVWLFNEMKLRLAAVDEIDPAAREHDVLLERHAQFPASPLRDGEVDAQLRAETAVLHQPDLAAPGVAHLLPRQSDQRPGFVQIISRMKAIGK